MKHEQCARTRVKEEFGFMPSPVRFCPRDVHLALTLVARLVAAKRERASALDVALLLALVIGVPVVVVAVTLMFYIVRAKRLTAALRSADPEAFIAQMVSSPSTIRPLDQYADEVNGYTTRVGPTSYLTLVVDEGDY